jgi:hypothetical protein
MLVHIHQGGTINTYCGQSLTGTRTVGWESAHRATCDDCLGHFISAPAPSRPLPVRWASLALDQV